MRFRPCIDIHSGRVKQIVGATLNDKGAVENFVSDKDASYYAEIYKEYGLYGGHIIMLGSGNEIEAFKALKIFPGGMQIGGGINPDNACKFLDAGASHVIVTSYIFKDGNFNVDNLKRIKEKVGKERLVIDLSCRKKNNYYYVVTERWQNFTEFTISKENIKILEDYCSEFLVHAVDVEGMKEGVDSGLISLLADSVSIPATYAGGVKDYNDITEVYKAGKGRLDLTIGSALDIFGGAMKFNDVINRDEFRNM
jgi:phosphoribosylformimino-5-aminoimidazole carboxamide ribotide isomerase